MSDTDKTDGLLAVMFAAVADPARLYEKHGNDLGWRMVSDCLAEMATISRKHEGRIIKTVGEEIICVFADATKCALAANEMHLPGMQ